MAKNRFQDISIDKVGSGSFYTAGKLGGQFKRRGMAGLLRAVKATGRHSYAKNLSPKDLEKFQTVVGKRLSRLTKHSEGFSLKTRREIMGEFEKMRRAGAISAADKDDFRSIVNALGINAKKERAQTEEASLKPKEPTKRAANFVTASQNQKAVLTPEAQKHIKANIAIDNIREAEGDSPIRHDPRSSLGRLEQAENDSRIKKSSRHNQGIDLPDQGDTTAKRGDLADDSKDKIIELDIG